MNNNREILNELEEISTLVAALPKGNVYHLYDNYFVEMQQTVLAKIKSDVPDGYFDNLSNVVLQKIKANEVVEELEKISPLLAEIGRQNVYTAPEKYFQNIDFATSEKGKGKVVKFGKFKIVKYAVAAVVTGLLGFSIFTFVNKSTVAKPNAATAAVIKEAAEIISTNSFEKDFAALTDKDLEKYLVQNGEDVNAAMVASTAENVELPAALDYYLDPKTLDEFLNDNNLKN